MKLEHVPSQILATKIKKILAKHLDLNQYRVFFFGSRVKGDSFEHSDIDVGIEGPRPLDAKTKFYIKEELDKLPFLYKIDLVDFASLSSSFKKVAGKHKEYF